MAGIKRFQDIEAWQEARKLAKHINGLIENFKISKNFSLKDQMQRAATSIMSNIAEGFERKGDKEFRRFLYISKGSAAELNSLLYVVLDMKYITEKKHAELEKQIEIVSKKLANFIKYLNKSIK